MVSFLSSLVGLRSLHALVLIQKTLSPVSVVLFVLLFRNRIREKRGGRGGQGEDTRSMKYDNNIELFFSHKSIIINLK